jgi:hypothetical protein
MPVGLFSEEEESDSWINLSNPLSALVYVSEDVKSSLVTCAVSVSSNSSVPFLPDVGWCSPSDDSVNVNSMGWIEDSSSSWVSGIGVWAWCALPVGLFFEVEEFGFFISSHNIVSASADGSL